MNLDEAVLIIRRYLSQLNKNYTREVFDEYSIVSFKATQGKILFYEGSREAEFKKEFSDDIVLLRKEILADHPGHGDFGFTRSVCPFEETWLRDRNFLPELETGSV